MNKYINYNCKMIKQDAIPILFELKEECCGCSLCYFVCKNYSKNAISMLPDEEGFLYPIVDLEKCIGCKKCEKICGFKKGKSI